MRPTFILVFLSVLRFAYSEISVPPNDVDAILGTSVIFNCSSSIVGADVQWVFYPIGKTMQVVYAFGKISPQYANRSTVVDHHNLLLSSVTVDDAGTYECQEDYGQGVKQSAELIVLESNPVCRSSSKLVEIVGKNNCGIQPSRVTLTCSVQYQGKKDPTMEWKANGRETTITSGVSKEIRGNRVLYNLTLNADSIVNGSSFSCRPAKAQSLSVTCNSGAITTIGTSDVTSHCECHSYEVWLAIVCTGAVVLSICVGVTSFFLRKTLLEKSRLKTENNELKKGHTPEEYCTLEAEKQALSAEKNTIMQEKNKLMEEKNKLMEEKNKLIEEKNKLIEEKNKLMKAMKSELESLVYPLECIDYVQQPIHVADIQTDPNFKERKFIRGIAVLGKELMVLHKNSTEIEIYDFLNTFKVRRKILIPEILQPFDLTCGIADRCLFLIGQFCQSQNPKSEEKEPLLNEFKQGQEHEPESKIVRLDLDGKLLDPWPILADEYEGRLSTCGSNLVVCFSGKKVIKEFSRNGQLVHEVKLLLNEHPLHAIKVSSMHFAVSSVHQYLNQGGIRVVDLNGKSIITCQDWVNSTDRAHCNKHFTVPIYLMNDRARSLIVADKNNRQVLLFNSSLKYQRKLIELQNNQYAVRICFNESQDLIFVATRAMDDTEDECNSTKLYSPGLIRIFRIRTDRKVALNFETASFDVRVPSVESCFIYGPFSQKSKSFSLTQMDEVFA